MEKASLLAAIDEYISILQQARAIFSGRDPLTATYKRGRSAKRQTVRENENVSAIDGENCRSEARMVK